MIAPARYSPGIGGASHVCRENNTPKKCRLVVVVILGIFCIPHLGQAIHNLKPLAGGFFGNWNGFVGIVLALSGVEAIANATSVMKLDPGSTDDHPTVSKTSTPAILWVMAEVCIFTALLGLGARLKRAGDPRR